MQNVVVFQVSVLVAMVLGLAAAYPVEYSQVYEAAPHAVAYAAPIAKAVIAEPVVSTLYYNVLALTPTSRIFAWQLIKHRIYRDFERKVYILFTQ